MTEQPIFHGILKVADTRLFDGKGRDVMTLPGGPQRLAACANALKDVWFPAAHVPAMENRIERLEQLRKEAVARIPEEGRYEDTPETAHEAGRFDSGSLTEIEVKPQVQVLPDGANVVSVKGGSTGMERSDSVERHAPHSTTTPALLRLEPAGEAAAWPWRFDMENAPRGSFTTTTRQGKDGPIEVKLPRRDIIIAASKCGKVTQSYWIPDAERWCFFTKDSPPVAWMAWPSWPAEALQGVAA